MTAVVNTGLVLASRLSDFTAYMASGITKGAVVALAALGFLLTYKATAVVNFAQGSLITLGAYFAIWGNERWGMPIVVAYLFSIAVLFIIGVGIERVAYAPLRGRSIHVVVIATLGASIIIDTLINLWYGPNPRALDTPADGSFKLFGATIPWHRVIVLVVTLLAVAALIFTFNKTQYGRQVRAVAADRDTARLYGVRVNLLSMTAFGLASALAALAGVLIAPLQSVDITFGFLVMLGGFAAAILGGFGSLTGVVVGGMIIGFVEQVLASYNYFGWNIRDYQSIWPFILMLLVIAVRPTGLFTRGEAHGRL
ncbi:MAG TPA: branched-chain amino acid ABC transporter permease [Acidimicrobiales bacterium]